MALFSLAARAGIPAARSALRFLSKMKKPPKTGITVFRGEPWDASPKLMKEVRNWMYGPTAKYGQSRASPLKYGAAGRWFTQDPKFASRFSGYTGFGNLGRIKKVTISPKELKLAKKLSTKIHQREGRPGYEAAMVISKKALARAKTDHLQTLINNFYKNLGIYRGKHGGLARILEV
jgi:hypothetical protein